MRRTNEDKRRAVFKLLADDEWAKWSDREIARQCGVGPDLVGTLRPSPSVGNRQMESREVSRGGKTYTMNTARIGGAPREKPSEPERDFSSAPQVDLQRVAVEFREEVANGGWIVTSLEDVIKHWPTKLLPFVAKVAGMARPSCLYLPTL